MLSLHCAPTPQIASLVLLLALSCLTVGVGGNRGATTLIEGADTNEDGDLGREEISNLIRTDIGGSAFDEAHEINRAANGMFQRLDTDRDGLIESTEFLDFWKRRGWLRSVDETVEWLHHAVQLSQYEQAFRENAVTGYDFPQLIEDNGRLLSIDLAISSKLHRRQLLRAMRMVLFGVASLPKKVPEDSFYVTWTSAQESCSAELVWSSGGGNQDSSRRVLADHRFEVGVRSVGERIWRKCYNGTLDWYTHEGLVPGERYEYRVRAWNLLGPGSWQNITTQAECVPTGGWWNSIGGLISILTIVGFTRGVIGAIEQGVGLLHEKKERAGRANPPEPALFHDSTNRRPRVTLITSDGNVSSDEPTPHTPSLASPVEGEQDELLYLSKKSLPEGTEQESPGVYSWSRDPATLSDGNSKPYTAEDGDADDERGTLCQPDWESSEEETPPSSPKHMVMKPAIVPARGCCPGCSKKFKWPSRREHQCRRCLSIKCSKCTLVGCGFPWVECGDKCICHECQQQMKKAKRVHQSNLVKKQSEARLHGAKLN